MQCEHSCVGMHEVWVNTRCRHVLLKAGQRAVSYQACTKRKAISLQLDVYLAICDAVMGYEGWYRLGRWEFFNLSCKQCWSCLQVACIDSHAVMTILYVIMAHCSGSRDLEDSEDIVEVSLYLSDTMRMLEKASHAIVSLPQEAIYLDIAHALTHMMKDTRGRLDSKTMRLQRECCAAAELSPLLCHKSSVAQLQPFKIKLLEYNVSIDRQMQVPSENEMVANLGPTSFLHGFPRSR